MTMRDTFAAAALAGTFARAYDFNLACVVCDAYAAADEMLKVREMTRAGRETYRKDAAERGSS